MLLTEPSTRSWQKEFGLGTRAGQGAHRGCSHLIHCPGHVTHIPSWSFQFPGLQSTLGSTRKLQWEHPPMTRRSTQVLCLLLRHQCVLEFSWLLSCLHGILRYSKEVAPHWSVDHACSPYCYLRSEDTGCLLDSGCQSGFKVSKLS